MREFSAPPTLAVPTTGNLTDDVVRNAREAPDAVAFSRHDGTGWQDVTAARFLADVVAVAKGLLAAGVGVGDRVALMSRTRYEWTLVDYAIWFAGAVTVPIYETSPAEQVEWILRNSRAVAAVVEGAGHLARVTSVRRDLPHLEHAWTIEGTSEGTTEGAGEGGVVDVLTRLGAHVDDTELERRRTTAGPGDLATLVYTSGTTGRPKGCRLTHGSFMVELGVTLTELDGVFPPPEGAERASTLLFLPLAHVFARIIQIGAVRARVRLGFTADVTSLPTDLHEFRPTFLLAVPRVFEKIFNTASQRATADGHGTVFDRAADAAIAYSRALDRGRVPLPLRARHAVYDRLVHARLREALGGRCTFAMSGGAPLGERLGHFYRGIGITVLEGYGLTESTGVLTVNLPDANKVGTVGRPLPGTAVRVADDGELLFRGEQVFAGYWDDDEATRSTLGADGWLHTGDVGEVDDEGFVRVTGRKKEIIVTAGGKNVAPAVLEDRLRAAALISQALVVGDGQPFIAAVVTIDEESFPAWAQAHGKPTSPSAIPGLVRDPDLLADIQRAVDDANTAVSKAESIRRFVVLPHDWTEEGGQLTPSLKLRRTVVARECKDDIAGLYR